MSDQPSYTVSDDQMLPILRRQVIGLRERLAETEDRMALVEAAFNQCNMEKVALARALSALEQRMSDEHEREAPDGAPEVGPEGRPGTAQRKRAS